MGRERMKLGVFIFSTDETMHPAQLARAVEEHVHSHARKRTHAHTLTMSLTQ